MNPPSTPSTAEESPLDSARFKARVTRIGTAALLAAALLADPSHAAGNADARARERYKQAQAAYDLGRFDDALKAYSEAYEIKALPGFLFNIAQCHRLLGHHDKAKFFYLRYMDLSPQRPKNASQVEALLKQVEEKLADEVRQRRAAEEAERSRRQAEQQAQQSAQIRILAPPVNDTVAAALTQPPVVVSEEKSVLERWWFWTGVGVVVAGAATTTWIATAPRPRTTSLGEVGSR